jgi:heme exporter protein A
MTLDILNLSFEREHRFLFENISENLVAGDCLQITGANGSGKSTLLRLLAGFIPAEAETIFWQKKCISAQRASYQPQLHYVGHHSGVRAHLTVKENLIANAALLGGTIAALETACEKTGLTRHQQKFAADLSAGQRQRLALARLLMMKKPLWILDEPLTALDIEGRDYLQTLLSEHLDAGGIAVIATHHEFSSRVKKLVLGGCNV